MPTTTPVGRCRSTTTRADADDDDDVTAAAVDGASASSNGGRATLSSSSAVPPPVSPAAARASSVASALASRSPSASLAASSRLLCRTETTFILRATAPISTAAPHLGAPLIARQQANGDDVTCETIKGVDTATGGQGN